MTQSVICAETFLQRVELPIDNDRAELLIAAGDTLADAAMAGSVVEVSQNVYTRETRAALHFTDQAVARSFFGALACLS